MDLSSSRLRTSLYAEHHEEVAFLYSQIVRLRIDEATSFTRLVDVERRLVAHVDALALGGAEALRFLANLHDRAESGHWYLAVLLACQRRDVSLVRQWVTESTADAGDARAHAEGVDALRHAMPSEWRLELPAWIEAAGDSLAAELADLAVVIGVPCQVELARRLNARRGSGRLVRALGRANVAGASTWLIDRARSGATAFERCEALLALADMGARDARELARQSIDNARESHLVLGLIGDRDDARRLVQLLASPGPHVQTVVALGLLGELTAVRPLMALLDHDELGSAAADALECITGAGLHETVLKRRDEQNPDEGAYLGARSRARKPADQFGETMVDRLSQDRLAWSEWLGRAASRFDAGQRYRLGKVWSAETLIDSLSDPIRSCNYRQLVCEELAMRLAAPQRIDLRFSVGWQLRCFERLRVWACSLGPERLADPWPYAGV